MPSLIRFLLLAGILAGIIYGGMIALVAFVEPQPREMSQTIPPARLNK
ncbi:MAG: histidine kinase [Methylocella sp.]